MIYGRILCFSAVDTRSDKTCKFLSIRDKVHPPVGENLGTTVVLIHMEDHTSTLNFLRIHSDEPGKGYKESIPLHEIVSRCTEPGSGVGMSTKSSSRAPNNSISSVLRNI